MDNGSNILAVVGGAALAAGMVGIHLVQALLPHEQHFRVVPHPTAIVTATTARPTATVAPHPTVIVSPTATLRVQVPTAPSTAHVSPTAAQIPTAIPTLAPTRVAPAATSMQPNPAISGGQATYTNRHLRFRLAYPSTWPATPSPDSYEVDSPDRNAGVGVYVEASAAVDTTSLESAVTAKLPMFLQQYGGSAAGAPQYQLASVDGLTAVVSGFAVAKDGVQGVASVSAVYNAGEIYYVWGVVADGTSALAAQDPSQVQAIMNNFHLD